MNSNRTMIHKLQQAINENFHQRILFNKTQFFSENQDRPVTMYILKQAIWDEERHKNKNIELFSSCSMIQIVLYLRDLWFALNGWEIPDDNEQWTKAKAQYAEKHQPNDVDVTMEDGHNERKYIVRKDGWDNVVK